MSAWRKRRGKEAMELGCTAMMRAGRGGGGLLLGDWILRLFMTLSRHESSEVCPLGMVCMYLISTMSSLNAALTMAQNSSLESVLR